jgi:hypothetical protein
MLGSLPYPLRNSGRRESSSMHHQQAFTETALLDPRTQLPRTMPYFASCAMQGSYALLMLVYKTRVAKDRASNILYDDGHDPSAQRLIEELSHGLEHIVGAVSNYSRAFEALGGMRGDYIHTLYILFDRTFLLTFCDNLYQITSKVQFTQHSHNLDSICIVGGFL